MNDPNRIYVAIVDDHAVVRSGLIAFLEIFDDLALVGAAGSGQAAVQLCDTAHVDVVLMDLIMPGMNGAAATRAIRQRHPHIQVIALTSFHEDDLVQEALQAGAIGYLLKNVTADELAAAVRAVYGGRPTLAPEITQALIHVTTHPLAPGHGLTAREREVLGLMIKGMNNAEIAVQLVVSRSTVKFYVSNILAKLHVASRVEAVAMAVEQHMIARPQQHLVN